MPIDIIFIVVFAFGFWKGYSQGIIGTVFNLAAYVFGIALGFKLTPTTTNILNQLFHSENPSMFVAAFLVNLFLIMFILRQVAKILESGLQAAYLGVFNQMLGGALLGSFFVLIYSILLWFLVQVQFINNTTIAESRSYPLLEALPGRAKSLAFRFKPMAEDAWGSSLNWMNRVQKFGVEKTETKPKLYQVPDDGKGIEDIPETSNPRPRPSSSSADDNGIEQ